MRYDLEIADMTWSYSRLSSFDECPYKWFLTYLYRDKNGRELPRQSGFFAEFGSFVHRIMELWLSGILERDELSSFYARHFNESVRAKAPNPKMRVNYFRQGLLYFDSFSWPEQRTLGVEKKVEFKFAGVNWLGYIDVLSERDGKLVITDHKSRTLKPRSNRGKPTKSDQELDSYLRQLYVYSAAVKAEYGRYPDVLEFNCFRSDERQRVIQEPFNLDQFKRVEDWAGTETERIISNSVWNAEPEFWRCKYLCDVCKHCEYKG